MTRRLVLREAPAGMTSSRIAAPVIRGAAIRDPCRRRAGHLSRHTSPAGTGRGGLADLDFGAEPSRRAGRQPGSGTAAGQVLQAKGQRAGPRPEAEHDGHLHHPRRGPRRHDAPDPGLLTRGEGLGEQADPLPDSFGRPGSELSRRPGAGQDFRDHLGKLPGPCDRGVRCPFGGVARAERERRAGRLGASGGAGVQACARTGDGYLARRRARGSVHLAVIGRPVAGHLDEPEPAEGARGSGWWGSG